MNQLQSIIVGVVNSELQTVRTPADLKRITKSAQIVMRNNRLFLNEQDYHDTADDIQVGVLRAFLQMRRKEGENTTG